MIPRRNLLHDFTSSNLCTIVKSISLKLLFKTGVDLIVQAEERIKAAKIRVFFMLLPIRFQEQMVYLWYSQIKLIKS